MAYSAPDVPGWRESGVTSAMTIGLRDEGLYCLNAAFAPFPKSQAPRHRALSRKTHRGNQGNPNGSLRRLGRTMIGIDLFAGAGGMSTGAVQAGIDVRFAVESDKHAASAYRKNHLNCGFFLNDIRCLSAQRLKAIPRGSDGVVVFGGPPCQGFSYSNSRTRGVGNRENWLFEEFIRVTRILEPDFVVFENVEGIVNTTRGFFLEKILDEFHRLRYSLNYGVLNALDFGVPQRRTRFFMIGSRAGSGIALPQTSQEQQVPTTVKDAFSDLPILENGANIAWRVYADTAPSAYAKSLRNDQLGCSNHLVSRNNRTILRRYRYVPPGSNWKSIPASLMSNYKDRSRCHTGIYHRLRLDRPSIVIGNYRKNMLIHPTQDRGLSVREAARLQSFPDWYEFTGSIGFQQQQVGNAVPPLLARAVFSQLILN